MRVLLWSVGAILVGVSAFATYSYMDHLEHYPTTNDAYIKGELVQVAAQVMGEVVEVSVEDQALVNKGQLLVSVDPRSYEYRVEQAKAKLDQVDQAISGAGTQVQAARAELRIHQSQQENVQLRLDRMRELRKNDAVSQSVIDDTENALKSAEEGVRIAETHVQQAIIQVGEKGSGNEKVREAMAAYNQLQLDLSHTKIVSPCNGRVANLELQPGELVQPGRPLFTVVCNERFWVYANFKETELTRIRPGQPATIKIDMYPGQEFHGVVQNLGAGSGTAFSLLPPENATGNWVKVTQRVPVRILITDLREEFPLRVEISAEATVDTGKGETPIGYPYNHPKTVTEAVNSPMSAAATSGASELAQAAAK